MSNANRVRELEAEGLTTSDAQAAADAETGAKHTPGPWKIGHSGYANTPFVIFTGFGLNLLANPPKLGDCPIAEVYQDESPRHEEMAANARLIAAAPELFKALNLCATALMNCKDDTPEAAAYIAAEEALAKAEGRS